MCAVSNRDRCATPRAGPLDCVDAILPWRVVDDPLPPPVPPKREVSARPPAEGAGASAAEVPKRVTPWLHRRVKTPVPSQEDAQVTRDHHRLPEKASSVDIKGYPTSPKPPSYRSQLQVCPSEESFRILHGHSKSTDSLAKSATARPPVVVSSIQVLVHTPANPALVNKIDRHEARKATSSHSPTPQPSIGSFHDAKSRRGAPVAPSLTRLPKRTQPPNYPEPFPAAPPPYRASPEESSLRSGRSRSLPRSRKHSSRSALEKEAPLPALPDHPRLSPSAVSRIQAAYKVSNEFGNAVMRQEVRLAIPSPEHMDPVPVPTPRVARHFMSAADLDWHRKAKQREHEARQRTMSSKSSLSVERPSRQCRPRN